MARHPLTRPAAATALRAAAAALAALAVSLPCAAAPYDDGLAALERHDYPAALSLFQRAARAGQPAAAYGLGQMYLDGLGTPRDPAAAATWFKAAAAAGNPGAQFRLGLMYQKGLGLRRDEARAAGWYLKSADQGYSDAQIRLGSMYALGRGVAQDDAEAARWFAAAASHGDADAALYLALLKAQAPGGRGGTMTQARFHEVMNAVFGQGRWRETGGYRSPAMENRLRAEGAETVPRGELSHHSMGTPDAPGAYDMVVRGLSPEAAAARLRRSGVAFRRLFPEGEHGGQGAHLHVEPATITPAPPTPAQAAQQADERRMARRDADALLESAAARGDMCARQAIAAQDATRRPAASATAKAPPLATVLHRDSCD